MVLRRREQHALVHGEDVARRALGEIAVAEHHHFFRAGVHRLLAQQAVGEQRCHLDVAAQPAKVGGGDGAGSGIHLFPGRGHQRVGHHEHRRHRLPSGKRVVALRHAARYLEVDRLVIAGMTRDQVVDQPRPLRVRHGIGEPDGIEAALQAAQMLGQAERAPRVGRDHFVDAIAEYEAAIKRRDLRFFDRHEFAVQICRFIHAGPLADTMGGDPLESTPARWMKRHQRNSSRSVSQPRPRMPATGTLSSATTGISRNRLPSSVTLSVPIFCPTPIGASSGCMLSMEAFSLS